LFLVNFGSAFPFSNSNGFDAADTDKNGVIDKKEFQTFAKSVSEMLGVKISDQYHEDGEEESASVDFPIFGDLDSKTFWAAFINSLLMIIVTELGDKTFFIAAILAMRQDRWTVYIGALGALALMTVLSAIMGFALPNLLPKQYTHFASALLFLYFGIRLLKDATEMEAGKHSDELEEVEEELVGKKDEGAEDDLESNKGKAKPVSVSGATNVLTQAFTLTFLAEWGDRSQIATIALASAKDPLGVTFGGILGHAFCTGLAVIGGRMLASRISEKTVATIGGLTFLAFAIHSFVYPDAFD
jgi:putative Ca2+/H+ antiporter (TMEM165/GDT1 family)